MDMRRGANQLVAPVSCGAAMLLLGFIFEISLLPTPSAWAEEGAARKKAAGGAATRESNSATRSKNTSTPRSDSKDEAGVAPRRAEAETKTARDTGSQSEFAPNVSIAPADLMEFAAQPMAVRKLIESGLELARMNLTYVYGSCDPATGGMDCSGFIYHILRQHGFSGASRDSSGQYVWVRRARGFRAVISRKLDSFELDELLPGDLLFWTGTYAVNRDPPITHVMLYLGTEKATGTKVMVGSSDGRTYRGQKRNGVSVFDFILPRPEGSTRPGSTFVGYGRIPGLRD